MHRKIQILKTVFIFTCLFLSLFIMAYAQVNFDTETDIKTENTGSLRVITDIPDVKIYINGELEGLAHPQKPLIREYLPVGTIIVTVKPKDLPSVSRPIVISSEDLSDLVFQFAQEVSSINNPGAEPEAEPEPEAESDENEKIREPALSLEQLLSVGFNYFQKQRYMIPEPENAFEMYKSAIKLSPDNNHARKNIYEMLKIYETLGTEYENKDYDKALIYYQNYIVILEYCLNTFQDSGLKELLEQAMEKKVELNHNIELSNNLAAEADSYFIAQKFTTPKHKNAFMLYKASLDANPNNEYAQKRIQEIFILYKKQGDQAFQKQFYKKARRFYKKCLLIAEYELEEFNSKRFKKDLEKIKNRVKQAAAPEKRKRIKNKENSQKAENKLKEIKKEGNE